MIIIEVTGGLGNQMFQYALYAKLKEMGKDVRLDLSGYRKSRSMRKFELDIFKVDYQTATSKEIRKYKKSDLMKRLSPVSLKEKIYVENLDEGYQEIVFSFDDMYLSGYWQCEKYFADIRKILLGKFSFPVEEGGVCREVLSQIRKQLSVSIHVRRGDYLTEQNAKVYGNICTLDYYRNAVAYIRKKVKSAVFFIFTNDIDWAKEHVYEEGMVIVDCNVEDHDYMDMFLMSQCKHNIIANSSFSWWGAWLNQNTDQIVISPKKWFQNHEVANQICQSFITVES